MRNLLSALLMLMLLFSTTHGERTAAPAILTDIRNAASTDEARTCVILPTGDELPQVQPGYIRYITQDRIRDDVWRKGFWLGGEIGGELDLTEKKDADGNKYLYHAGVMCTRAVFSMAMSYLGIDITPGAMSALIGQRDLDPPYDEVTELLNVERVMPKQHVFNTMMENYLSGEGYSPVYLYIEKPDGGEHALLVVAALPQKSRYVVVDPQAIWYKNEPYRVYMLALNKTRSEVANCSFNALIGSEVKQLYQWRLKDAE